MHGLRLVVDTKLRYQNSSEIPACMPHFEQSLSLFHRSLVTVLIRTAYFDACHVLMLPWKHNHCVPSAQFRHVPGNLYRSKFGADIDRNTNELVIRIQPEEAIYLKINNKVPGLGLKLDTTRLDLQYATDLNAGQLPDAYERLLLDVVNGALYTVSLIIDIFLH